MEQQPIPLRPDSSRSTGTLLVGATVGSLLFLAGLLVLFAYPIPRYIRLSPGPSPDVAGLINVSGPAAYKAESRLGLALVIVGEVDNLFELARAKLDDTSEVVPRRIVIPDEVTDEQNDQQNQQLMTTSQQDATYVALDYLGYPVMAEGTGVRVASVARGTPADGVLMVSDVISSSNGLPVYSAEDLVADVRASGVGGTVRLDVRRGDGSFTAELKPASSPDDGRAIIGVTLEPLLANIILPPDVTVTIDAQGIGGPSAGLIYALGIIDVLTPGEITGGHNIAATGTISLSGRVGEVGGLREKAVGVERAGAEYFLVPAGDNFEAAQAAVDNMKVVPVHNLGEALEFLKGLRNGTELQLP